jgi:hypothetical protein
MIFSNSARGGDCRIRKIITAASINKQPLFEIASFVAML